MCFKAPTINIPPPPPAPVAPPPSPREEAIRDKEFQLLEENLGLIKQQRTQDEASRAEFERLTGKSLGAFTAEQARSQAEVGDLVRAAQTRQIERERLADEQLQTRRTAFQTALGITPEQAEVEETGRQIELSRDLHARYKKALAGELPVDPALERSIGEEEQRIREELVRAAGPGAELGDIGLRNIGAFKKRAEELRHAARTGAIGEAEQFGFALTPGLLRITQPRDARGGADALSRNAASNLALPQLFRGQVEAGPPQLSTIAQALFADRALQARAGELGYQGNLDYNRLLTGARSTRATTQAGINSALLSGAFGLGGAGIGAI